MKSFDKVLVPVDFSMHAEAAIDCAVDIASRYDASNTLVNVIRERHGQADHTCSLSDDVATAEARMRQFQVRRLPVVDATGKLVGIVSMNDLAIEAAQEKGTRRHDVRLNDVALTLAGICQHRHESLAVDAQ